MPRKEQQKTSLTNFYIEKFEENKKQNEISVKLSNGIMRKTVILIKPTSLSANNGAMKNRTGLSAKNKKGEDLGWRLPPSRR